MARWWQYPGQSFVDPGSLGDAEVVKVEDFWQPFSEPVRQLPGVLFAAALAVTSGVAPIDPEVLGEAGGAADTSTEWFVPFSEPVLARGLLYTAALVAGETTTANILDPRTDQVAIGPGWAAGAWVQNGDRSWVPEAWTPFAGAALEWFVPLSEPVPPLAAVAYTATQAASGTAPLDPDTVGDPEEPQSSHWYVPFSEPTPPLPSVGYAAAQSAAGGLDDPNSLNDPELTELIEWFRPLSEPVWQLAGVHYYAALAASGVAPIDSDTLNQPEDVTLDGWLVPLSQPTPPLPGVLYFAALAAAGEVPIGAETLGDPEASKLEQWWRPLSQPRLELAGVKYGATLAASGQAPTDLVTLGDAEPASVEQWWQPFSEPLWQPAGNAYAAAQSAGGLDDPNTLNDPEVTEFIEWFAPFSEPVLVPLHAEPPPPFYVENIVVLLDESTEWWTAFSQPTPKVPGLLANNQQALAIDPNALNEEGGAAPVVVPKFEGLRRHTGRLMH